jgi:hypothetical protein
MYFLITDDDTNWKLAKIISMRRDLRSRGEKKLEKEIKNELRK